MEHIVIALVAVVMRIVGIVNQVVMLTKIRANMLKQYFLVTCLLLFGCKHASNRDVMLEDMSDKNGYVKISIDNINDNTILKYSDIYDTVRFIPLETTDNSLIGRIDKIVIARDKIIIMDISVAKKVFVFDINGNFLNLIGKNGEGPEEYDFPSDIVYDEYNDELLVWCYNRKTIMRFQLNGTFVNNIVTDWWASSIYVVQKDQYLLYLNNHSQKNNAANDFNIIVVNHKGKAIKKLLPFDKNEMHIPTPSRNDFYSFQREILFTPYYRNKTFIVNSESAIMDIKYYFDFGKHTIPVSILANMNKANDFSKTIRNNREYAFNIAFAETGSHVIYQFVYKGKIFTGFYLKETNIVMYSAIFFNDINLLPSGGLSFLNIQGDSLVGYVEPQEFIQLQNMVKEFDKGKKNLKDILLEQLNTHNELKRNFAEALKNSYLHLSEEEINFINTVEESDNPIIRIATLKKNK